MDRQKKHIIFIARWYPNRYDPMLGLFVQRHAEAAALYNDISVIYAHSDDNISVKYDICQDKINGIDTVKIYFKKHKSKIISLIRYFRACQLGFKRLRKPDIIHVNILTRCGIIALWRKITKGTPYIITEHWSRYLPGNDFSGIIRKRITKTVVKNASAVTTVTELLAKAMQSHGLRNSNYTVVPNVVDTDTFKPEPHHNTIPKIIHISCFENKSKNITSLIDALQILEKENIRFRCILIGDGIDFQYIKDYSKKIRDRESIVFTGILEGETIANELASGDFLVLSSNYETQGVVILEAFACGIPVVATKVGGIPEIVNDSNGILVSPNAPEELAQAIKTMIVRHKDYNPLALRENIEKVYSPSRIGEAFASIYNEA
ncbi:MAG: glycosyltransferase [Candidatus Limimorpha sp.]